jgi:hypothetical protein
LCRREDDALVGVFNISEIVRGLFNSGYLGYYALNPHAGAGYMAEGLQLILRVAFSELRLHRLEANVQPNNERSLAVRPRRGIRARRLLPALCAHRRALARPRAARASGRGLARPPREGARLIRAALLVAAVALGGCAGTLTVTDGSKVVSAHPLPSYQVHEECFKLGEGDRVDFAFESSEPVDFNIHYHEGQAVGDAHLAREGAFGCRRVRRENRPGLLPHVGGGRGGRADRLPDPDPACDVIARRGRIRQVTIHKSVWL